MNSVESITFDKDKFLDVVHFICANTEPENMGNVKLHKILYFSDMLHFIDNQKPLTGAQYLKQAFGPTARYLGKALRELENKNIIKIEERNFYGYPKKDYISIKKFESNRLSENEKSLILEVIDEFCNYSAKEISELSHNVAWETADMGEVIPYVSAYGLIPLEMKEEDLEWGNRIAKQVVNIS